MSDPVLLSTMAAKLRPVGKDVSKGKGRLCLSSLNLQGLNRAFDEYNPEDMASSFHLTEAKASLQADLQFLLDLIQGAVALKLTPDLIDDEEVINISRFHKVISLELHKVDVKRVIGIQKLRSHLEQLTCTHNLINVSDVLDKCGGDFSHSFSWGELKQVNFSHNCIQEVNGVFGITPLLQILDLSHNQLHEFELIDCLPNLKELNLSYNKLDRAPKFKGPVCKRLHMLQLHNNFIEDISDLASLTDLQQLNLATNCLINHSSLLSISQMHSLYTLDLRENPLIFHPIHRTLTANYLNKHTASLNFVLDNVPLSGAEKSLAGSRYSIPQTSLGNSGNSSSENSLNMSIRKPVKARTVSIQEGHNIETAKLKKVEVVPSPRSVDVSHLDIKKKIEQMLQEGREPSSVIFEEVLNYPKPTSTVIIETVPDSLNQTFVTAKSDESDQAIITDEADIEEGEFDKDDSGDLSSDDEEILKSKVFTGGTTATSKDLCIGISETHMWERNLIAIKKKDRWSLNVVKSLTKGEAPNELKINFDVSASHRNARTYFMDDPDEFAQSLMEGMVRNRVPDRSIDYRCMKCDYSFSRVRTNGVVVIEERVTCPNCGSNHVIESK